MILQLCSVSDRGLLFQPLLYDLFQIRESASADKQDIPGIDGGQRHHGVLAACPYRHLYVRPFQKPQQSLLHALSADVPARGILFLGDLVDLVNKDDPALCLFGIIVCCRQQLGKHAFNIIPDITCLGKGGCIRYGKGHIQKSCKCFHQIGFSAACRPDHQHVRLFDLDIVHGSRSHTLVMIVHRNRNYLLCMLLPDHIIVKLGFDLMRRWNIFNIQNRFLFLFGLFLLDLLFVGNSAFTLQIRQIDKTDVGKSLPLHIFIQIVHQGRIIQHSLIIKLADCVHGSVHAVIADRNIVGQLEHFPCLALRSSADKTHILVILILLAVIFRLAFLCFLFGLIR